MAEMRDRFYTAPESIEVWLRYPEARNNIRKIKAGDCFVRRKIVDGNYDEPVEDGYYRIDKIYYGTYYISLIGASEFGYNRHYRIREGMLTELFESAPGLVNKPEEELRERFKSIEIYEKTAAEMPKLYENLRVLNRRIGKMRETTEEATEETTEETDR